MQSLLVSALLLVSVVVHAGDNEDTDFESLDHLFADDCESTLKKPEQAEEKPVRQGVYVYRGGDHDDVVGPLKKEIYVPRQLPPPLPPRELESEATQVTDPSEVIEVDENDFEIIEEPETNLDEEDVSSATGWVFAGESNAGQGPWASPFPQYKKTMQQLDNEARLEQFLLAQSPYRVLVAAYILAPLGWNGLQTYLREYGELQKAEVRKQVAERRTPAKFVPISDWSISVVTDNAGPISISPTGYSFVDPGFVLRILSEVPTQYSAEQPKYDADGNLRGLYLTADDLIRPLIWMESQMSLRMNGQPVSEFDQRRVLRNLARVMLGTQSVVRVINARILRQALDELVKVVKAATTHPELAAELTASERANLPKLANQIRARMRELGYLTGTRSPFSRRILGIPDFHRYMFYLTGKSTEAP